MIPTEPVAPNPAPSLATAETNRSLRNLVHAIAISMLILTGTVFVFIYRQVVLVRRQTTELVRFLAEYERSNATEFITRAHQYFAEYRKQHPDFTPIYLKYFGTNEPPPMTPGTAGAPKVTTPPSRPKP